MPNAIYSPNGLYYRLSRPFQRGCGRGRLESWSQTLLFDLTHPWVYPRNVPHGGRSVHGWNFPSRTDLRPSLILERSLRVEEYECIWLSRADWWAWWRILGSQSCRYAKCHFAIPADSAGSFVWCLISLGEPSINRKVAQKCSIALVLIHYLQACGGETAMGA